MSTNMYELTAALDATQVPAVATGHVAMVMAWEEIAEGKRRPGTTPEVDEATGAPFQVADVLMPLGRDGQPVLVGVRFSAHEVPELAPYAPVELVGLRVKVRASRTGKGVDVTFAADAVRPAGVQRQNSGQGRRSADTEAA